MRPVVMQAPLEEKLTVPSGQMHPPPASDALPDPASQVVRVTAKRNGEFGTCVRAGIVALRLSSIFKIQQGCASNNKGVAIWNSGTLTNKLDTVIKAKVRSARCVGQA